MDVSWRIAGSYLEACNCEAICPCRRIDGQAGGRSTEGICMGALSWGIETGLFGDVALDGLNVALVLRYDDDEEGSPWTFALYVDERGDERQRDALESIFLGRAGGDAIVQFPWARKPSVLVAVRPVTIELEHDGRRPWFRAGRHATVRIDRPFAEQATVTCVIPGHHRTGIEVVAEELAVREEQLDFEFSGKCGYVSTFEYSSEMEKPR
jgi:hypothetical protein